MLNGWKCSRMKLLILGLVIFLAPLSAQTLTYANTSNSAITPDIVVGDSWTLTIANAARNASVVLQFTKNGGTVQYYQVGTTDAVYGNFYDTQPVTSGSLGTYTNVWLVNGVQLGTNYNYEVIDAPTALTVNSVSVASPSCPSFTYGPNGFFISIKFQITGASGTLVLPNYDLLLEPYEYYTLYNQDGSTKGVGSGDIGASGTLWSPPSAQYASNSATYYDIPLGLCATYTYGSWLWANQSTYIFIGSSRYSVRPNQQWTSTGTGSNTGSVSSSYGDISLSR